MKLEFLHVLKKFFKGIRAPIIKALPHHQIQVSNDNLAIYYNEHN